MADGRQCYVITALKYVTRYTVATSVTQHTAKKVAAFLMMKEVVLRFGVFRKLLTDGAPELAGKVIYQLAILLQVKKIDPMRSRPQMIGLVERFNRTWKGCVGLYMTANKQNDWEMWVKFAVYAYNSVQHSTVMLTPNELVMGRRLRPPNKLTHMTAVTEADELMKHHKAWWR